MSRAQDPRVVRTRRLLITALTDLIVEEGYEAVTIRGIVRKAMVNRSTFYLHFLDKQDILTQLQDDILNGLTESLKLQIYSYELALSDYRSSNDPMKAHVLMFEHIQKNSSLYLNLLSMKEFRDRVTEVIKAEILRFNSNVLDATFMANGAVGIILYWLENGMNKSIMEMSLWLTKFTLFPFGKVI